MIITHKICKAYVPYKMLKIHLVSIVSFLLKLFGKNQDFPKGSVWGKSHFSKCLGRKGFGEEFEFSDFYLGEV